MGLKLELLDVLQDKYLVRDIDSIDSDGLDLDTFLKLPLYDKTTGKCSINDEVNSWFDTFIFYFMDKENLKFIDKSTPGLTAEQTEYAKDINLKSFYNKYGVLNILFSLSQSPDKTNAFKVNSDVVSSQMNEMQKDYQTQTSKLFKFILLKRNPEYQKYIDKKAFRMILHGVLLSDTYVRRYADLLIDATKTTQEEASAFYNDLRDKINFIDPSGEISAEFLSKISTTAFMASQVTGPKMNPDSDIVATIIEDAINQIVLGITQNTSNPKVKVFKQTYQELIKLYKDKATVVAELKGIVKRILTKDRSDRYIALELSEMSGRSAVQVRANEEVIAITNPGFKKVTGIKALCSGLAMVVMGACIFYTLKDIDSADTFQKAYMIGNCFVLFSEAVKHTYRISLWLGEKLISAGVFASISTKFEGMLAKFSGSMLGRVASAAFTSLVAVLNIAMIGYVVYDVIANWDVQTPGSLICAAGQIGCFIVMCCATNPITLVIAAVCAFAFAILAIFFLGDPMDAFMNRASFAKSSYDQTKQYFLKWATDYISNDPTLSNTDDNSLKSLQKAYEYDQSPFASVNYETLINKGIVIITGY